jgi:queuine tRNA-ribosyltransferase
MEIIAEEGNARVCKFKTRHGEIETPFFMPVATKASVKHLPSTDLKEINVPAIISNSLVLYLRPGLPIIKKFKGLHNFMNFNNVIFTDSGGFQMLRPSFLQGFNNKGIKFRSPFDGSKFTFTPEKSMQVQQDIASDVAMMLDNIPKLGANKQEVKEATLLTHDWAKRCISAHTDNKQLLFGITQGGLFKDIRKKSIEFFNKQDVDGLALGGLCIGEDKKDMHDIIKLHTKYLRKDKVRYLMGVGSPLDIIDSVYNGIDVFDSIFPTRNARHGTLFSSSGSLRILNKKYSKDSNPIDKNCDCFVCKNYSKAYIRYQLKFKEGVGYKLASFHNIHFITKLMNSIKTSIKENSFEKFRKDFIKSYKK